MRQTAADIDYAILDVAAGIFAIHGYSHTSVQQVADAVGYSKPGLLHRFGSKEALYRLVLSEVSRTADDIAGVAIARANDPDQALAVLELVTRRALARPGMMRMMLRAFGPAVDDPFSATVRSAGTKLLDALDHPLSTAVERLRVLLALELISTAAVTQHSRVGSDLRVDAEHFVRTVVPLAAGVLGTQPVTV